MNKRLFSIPLDRLALIAEVIGALAVVASVAYLAIQISDNNRLLRTQAHFNVMEVAQRPVEIMLQSESLAALLLQCAEDPEAVAQDVWFKCSYYIFMQANAWEYTYYQHRDGTIPASFWPGVDAYMSNEAQTNAAWVRFWTENGAAFGEPFHTHIENSIKGNPAYGK